MSQAPVTKELNLEIEVKLACDDLDRIRNAGFQLTLETPRHFEDNWLLDGKDQGLLNQGAALRVRSVNNRGVLTYKGGEFPRVPLTVIAIHPLHDGARLPTHRARCQSSRIGHAP